jgi:hypothetical protein
MCMGLTNLSGRCAEGFQGFPPLEFDALPCQLVVDPVHNAPLRKNLGRPVDRNADVVSFVSLLFFAANPAAIFRTVAIRIVDPLKLKSRFVRGLHVCDEVVQTQPSVAHGNAALPIPLIAGIVRVSASPDHASPAKVNRVAVLPVLRDGVLTKAPAALRKPSRDFVQANGKRPFPARTGANSGVSVGLERTANRKNGQPRKSLPDVLRGCLRDVRLKFEIGKKSIGAHVFHCVSACGVNYMTPAY